MKKLIISAFALTLLPACGAYESVEATDCSDISQIYGTWDVALNFDINQPPSQTEMILSGDGNSDLTGFFYGSDLEAAKLTATKTEYVFASETADVSNSYLHMARYKCSADKIEGQTWSKGRDFLMTWTAERSDG